MEEYCLGMITGWGSHHVDIAHWGMDTELTGPIAIEAKAEFPTSGLWNVHGPYHIEMSYANGATMIIDHKFPNGIRFEGSDGWIFVTRGAERVTSSDPIPKGAAAKALQASNPDIFKTPLGKDDVRLHESPNGDHHLDWITSIQTRKPAVTSAEVGAPLDERLHHRLDRHETRPQAQVGPREGKIRGRRRRQRPCSAAPNAHPMALAT